ncbi:ankyrin repeat domain-containing protein [Primorskyibacter sp. 2E233]|uniref:ankyrin repeat domain-containing protein n=1 Tax=Primorskyibacter sp. 2E233 TaxID=3413431 RepID=UPI003BF38E97
MRGLPIVLIALALSAQDAKARDGSQACNSAQQELKEQERALEGRRLHEALFRVAALNCPSAARDLLARGASVQARNGQGASPLAVAAGHGSVEVADLLRAAGADLSLRDLTGATPLLRAARNGRRKMVDWLLLQGVDVDAADKQGITPLIAAAFNGDLRMLKTLLATDPQINARESLGKTALIYAAGRAYPEVVSLLLSAGADVAATDSHLLTALSWVAGHANDAPANDGIKTAMLLLKAGANVKHRDDRGRDALMIAAQRGHAEMVAFLLAEGADATRRDKTGKSAADLAMTPEIAALLR